jgi:membrane protease YdiL (CAAX protease family)
MAVESVLLAVGLVGLSKITDVAFDRLDGVELLTMVEGAAQAKAAVLVGFVGAGIYEESVFRLAMIPAFYWTLRAFQLPSLGANVLAVTASSLFFSLAHHAGSPGEVFTWYAFIFRWLAGVYFAWVFVVRGFGVAVGAHAAYDILVGYFEWSF